MVTDTRDAHGYTYIFCLQDTTKTFPPDGKNTDLPIRPPFPPFWHTIFWGEFTPFLAYNFCRELFGSITFVGNFTYIEGESMLVTDLEEMFVQMQKTFPQEILLPDAHCVDQTSNISVAFQFRLRWSKLYRSSSSLWRGGRGWEGAPWRADNWQFSAPPVQHFSSVSSMLPYLTCHTRS